MSIAIASIVEGRGEVEALPVLIRRIALGLDSGSDVNVLRPIRRPKGQLIRQGVLEHDVDLAARKTGGKGCVLVLLDSDDGCPAADAPKLLARIRSARADIPSAIVLAKMEFEAWFLAGAESLRVY